MNNGLSESNDFLYLIFSIKRSYSPCCNSVLYSPFGFTSTSWNLSQLMFFYNNTHDRSALFQTVDSAGNVQLHKAIFPASSEQPVAVPWAMAILVIASIANNTVHPGQLR